MAIALLVAVALPVAAGRGAGWRDRAWPEHVRRVDAALADARAVDASRLAYAADFAVARALLERADAPQRLGDVVGTWQVRSIQVNAHGTFAYPWFRASIRRTADELWFEKTTGSQRRSGVLLPHGDGRSLAFLGGATVNDEPQAAYSRGRAAGPAPSDSAGRLYRIGARELLLVLDAEGGRYELYHLRR
jgi:hypothetical protein